jgi:hypothetical protein
MFAVLCWHKKVYLLTYINNLFVIYFSLVYFCFVISILTDVCPAVTLTNLLYWSTVFDSWMPFLPLTNHEGEGNARILLSSIMDYEALYWLITFEVHLDIFIYLQ